MDNITLNILSSDPRIVHVMFRGKWTWNDLDSMIQHNPLPRAHEQTPMYVVVDFTESPQMPPNVLVKTYNIISRSPANLRQTIVVSNNSFVEGIVTAFKYVFHKYQRAVSVVGSKDEALSLINGYSACDQC